MDSIVVVRPTRPQGRGGSGQVPGRQGVWTALT